MSLLGAAYGATRPLLFGLDAERAHGLGAVPLALLHRAPSLRHMVAAPPPPASLATSALGLTFPSPLGVAAGFDKAGALYDGLGALGFSFVEIGTVTARAQPGNPRPRLARLRADRAIVNRMGFNNPGAAAVEGALRRHGRAEVVLGVNIGKSKATPLDEAPADYAESARRLAPLADYLVVNVSSPNTPGLRSLQSVEALAPVLAAVQHELAALQNRVPLLVKIAPDLADPDVDAVVDLALARGLDGLVVANTTVKRDGLLSPPDEVARAGEGGLSGPPLAARRQELLQRIKGLAGPALALIAVGGIETADDARAALDAGAALVQVYTALIYGGPDLPRRILAGLAAPSP
jgi:dihydroorotate dehydrogenase